MNKSFESVIGYDSIKRELLQICDMLHHRKDFEKLGAKLPTGILLFGEPGLGKTLMANSFVKACGLPCFTVQRNKSVKFVESITDAFQAAKNAAPSIVLLDDMDKFANEDESHVNAPEYIAVQAGIDEVRNHDVIVVATANDIACLPNSLLRAGRFDRSIRFEAPEKKDAQEIIQFYLKNKPIAEDVNLEDISKMISYRSCAELECILNEAAIIAAGARKNAIDRADMIEAVLRMKYHAPDDTVGCSDFELKTRAYHEAGHLVAAEVLQDGSVGLASVKRAGRDSLGGFVHCCEKIQRRPNDVIVSLAGKIAVELYFPETVGSGCQSDLHRAVQCIREGINTSGTLGLSMLDPSGPIGYSENYAERNEAVLYAELERYVFKTRELILKNREFLEKITNALLEKETLLFSDIQKMKEECDIKRIAC